MTGRERRDASGSTGAEEKEYIFDRWENVKKLLWVFHVLCAALLLGDFVIHRHVAHPWEPLWGFYGFYGFISCWMLVVIAKQMRRVLMRDEDYYELDAD